MGRGAIVGRNLQGKGLGRFLVPLIGPTGNKDRTTGPGADGAKHIESTEGATGGQPRRQGQLAVYLDHAGQLARGGQIARQASDAQKHARDHLGKERRQILAYRLGGGRGGRPHVLVFFQQGALDPGIQPAQPARG